MCYTYRKDEGVIRIISARKATKKESKEYTKGMPYQNLINLYLRDCAEHHRKLQLQWT